MIPNLKNESNTINRFIEAGKTPVGSLWFLSDSALPTNLKIQTPTE